MARSRPAQIGAGVPLPGEQRTCATLEPISKLLAAVDTLYRWNDSAHGRTVGTHPGSFSGGAHSQWSSRTQTNPGARHVLEAVLWILNTGAQWQMLPQSYPNYKTVHRRFQTWCRN